VQVHPIKPTLKAPGIKLLKLKYDEPLSKFAFKSNMRRYVEVTVMLINQPDDVYKPRQGVVLRKSTRPTLNLLLLLRASA